MPRSMRGRSGSVLASAQPSYFGLRHVANARLATELQIERWLAGMRAATRSARSDLRSVKRQASEARPGRAVGAGTRTSLTRSTFAASRRAPMATSRCCSRGTAVCRSTSTAFWRRRRGPLRTAPTTRCGRKPARAFIPELHARSQGRAAATHDPGVHRRCSTVSRCLPNGKVDRQALPPPDFDTLYREQYVAPHTVTQQAVQGIWAAVLGIDTPGIHDNFFALGGHSLKVTQVVSRIAQDLKKIRLAAGLLQSADNRRTRRAAGRSAVGQRGRRRSPARRPRPTIPFHRRSGGSGSWPRWTGARRITWLTALVVRGRPRRGCSGARLWNAAAAARDPAHRVRRGRRRVAPTRASTSSIPRSKPSTCAAHPCRSTKRAGSRSPTRAGDSIWPARRWSGCACCAPAAASTCCSSTCITSSPTAGAWTCWIRESMQLYRGRDRGRGRLRCRRCASSIATTSPGRRRACVRACSSCANIGEASSAICRRHSTCRPTSRVRRCAPAAAAACTCDLEPALYARPRGARRPAAGEHVHAADRAGEGAPLSLQRRERHYGRVPHRRARAPRS